MGTPEGLEASIVPESGFPFRKIHARGLRRRISLDIFLTLGSTLYAFLQSWKILSEFKPQAVVGLGGYVSLPLVLASWVMRIPGLIHEQNAVPGLTNRFLGKLVKNIAVSYPGTEKFFSAKKNVRLTGNPIREDVCSHTAEEGVEVFGLDAARETLLVFGGSRGAKRINQTMVELYPFLRKRGDLQVLHFSGERDFEEVQSALEAAKEEGDLLLYRAYSYTNNIGAAYAVADLALCRAGATSIAELLACGVPAILVPYPFATDGHQEKNASFVVKGGAAVVVKDSDLTAGTVYELITALMKDRARLEGMKQSALELGKKSAGRDLAQMVLEIVVE